jgi:hypothetical protein
MIFDLTASRLTVGRAGPLVTAHDEAPSIGGSRREGAGIGPLTKRGFWCNGRLPDGSSAEKSRLAR